MKFFRRIWQEVRRGENIDLYVTVSIALVTTFLSITNIVPVSIIAPLNLAILALLSIAILGNRHKTETVLEKIGPQNERFLKGFSPQTQEKITQDIKQSTEINLVGVDMTWTLEAYYSIFQEKLRSGNTIKLLLIDPDSPACEIAAMRFYKPKGSTSQRQAIRDSLEGCAKLINDTNGKLEVRLAEHPLTFGAIMGDPETSHGSIYLWHYSFKMHNTNIPKMIILPTDEFWYKYFQQEIYSMWNAAKPWQSIASS